MTYKDAKLAALAAKAETCMALCRDALAANIALIDAPVDHTSFDSFQALEHACLQAGATWAAAVLEPVVVTWPPIPTVMPVQPASALPPGIPVVDPLDPNTYPPHLRRIDP